jgi:hypothetical protein
MDMNLTVTQFDEESSMSRRMFTHLIYSDPTREHFIRNSIRYYDNYYDYEDLEQRTVDSAILEITFDKDYEVDNVKPSDYYAHVPSWLVRLLTSRSRNR